MVLMQDQHRFNTKAWLLWTAGFVAFIIGGALATGVVGRINDVGSALIGGLIAGAVIGSGQWLVARRLLGDPRSWIPATAVAMGLGLLVGAGVVGYGTSLGELALMGLISGIPLGAAQAYLLRDRLANAWVWAAAVPLLWALGWTVTTAGGIDVDRQFAVFGAYGAITFMALSGVLLDRLRASTPAAPAPQPDPSTAIVQSPPRTSRGVGAGRTRHRRDAGSAGASQGPVRGLLILPGPVTAKKGDDRHGGT
jgi:hypothetical protein